MVAIRNCGATTGYATVVSESRGWLRKRAELFMIDGEALGEKMLKIRWVSDNELAVAVDPALRVFPATLTSSDLRVTYAPTTRLGS